MQSSPSSFQIYSKSRALAQWATHTHALSLSFTHLWHNHTHTLRIHILPLCHSSASHAHAHYASTHATHVTDTLRTRRSRLAIGEKPNRKWRTSYLAIKVCCQALVTSGWARQRVEIVVFSLILILILLLQWCNIIVTIIISNWHWMTLCNTVDESDHEKENS